MALQSQRELAAALEELARRRRERRLEYYEPYRQQREFHAMGQTKRERMFLAGNQLGKTWSGGMEAAAHLTGQYPSWWKGRRWPGAVRCWVAGVTGESTRDNPQRVLMGLPQEYGTGTIPKDAIVDIRMGRGLPDQIDSVVIRHRTGGISTVGFKAYEKGREKWQGETLDFIWLDEEPDAEIYSEALARVTARQGMVYLTATPLLGMTAVVNRFLSDQSADRGYVQMCIEDAKHIPEDERARIIAGYAPHERDARTRGIPMMGSGKVFQVPEDVLAEDALAELPRAWPRIAGLDIGWDHPTAVAWVAWDRDADCVHVYDVHRLSEATTPVHVAALRARGQWIPVAWPHDALIHDKQSGEQVAAIYRRQGVRMLGERATFPDGTNGVEAGLVDMYDRMITGRFKVAKHLTDWWQEFRLYHRKDGRLVKKNDDLISATRYAVMMLRFARTEVDARGLRQMQAGESLGDYDPMAW